MSDSYNKRVLRFDAASKLGNGSAAAGVFGQPNFTTNALVPPTNSSLNAPTSTFVDSSGALWVCDASGNRVLRYLDAANKPNGAPADSILGQSGCCANCFNEDNVITIASDGSVWIAGNDGSLAIQLLLTLLQTCRSFQ